MRGVAVAEGRGGYNGMANFDNGTWGDNGTNSFGVAVEGAGIVF